MENQVKNCKCGEKGKTKYGGNACKTQRKRREMYLLALAAASADGSIRASEGAKDSEEEKQEG